MALSLLLQSNRVNSRQMFCCLQVGCFDFAAILYTYLKLFKNLVKHQKIQAKKNIQTYISDVKFHAEHTPVVRRNQKNRVNPENRKTYVLLEKFVMEKPTYINIPKLAEVYFKVCTLRTHGCRFTYLAKQTIYTYFHPIICLHYFF